MKRSGYHLHQPNRHNFMRSAIFGAQPRTILLTRHSGALQWLRNKLGANPSFEMLGHLDGVPLQRNDRVYGTFPMHLAARLCDAGVECWMIDFSVPIQLRGVELTAEQLDLLNAKLVRYHVQRIEYV